MQYMQRTLVDTKTLSWTGGSTTRWRHVVSKFWSTFWGQVERLRGHRESQR